MAVLSRPKARCSYDPTPSARNTGRLTMALAVFGPLALTIVSPQTFWYLAAGAAAWAVAVVLKKQGVRIVRRIFGGLSLTPIWQAGLLGVWSAATELGLVSIVFVLAPRPMLTINVVAVGVGAACTEIIYLVVLSVLRRSATQRERWIEEAKKSFVVRHIFFIERAIACIGHVAARALIYVSIYRYSMWAALVAFAGFGIVDGAASYGRLQKWDWLRPRVAHLYYAMATVAVLLKSITVVALSRWGEFLR